MSDKMALFALDSMMPLLISPGSPLKCSFGAIATSFNMVPAGMSPEVMDAVTCLGDSVSTTDESCKRDLSLYNMVFEDTLLTFLVCKQIVFEGKLSLATSGNFTALSFLI